MASIATMARSPFIVARRHQCSVLYSQTAATAASSATFSPTSVGRGRLIRTQHQNFGLCVAKMSTSASSWQHTVTIDSINPCIKSMEYAVRGPLVIRATEIEKEIESVSDFFLLSKICVLYLVELRRKAGTRKVVTRCMTFWGPNVTFLQDFTYLLQIEYFVKNRIFFCIQEFVKQFTTYNNFKFFLPSSYAVFFKF